ncbi:MAG TPA: FAD-dependent oxidoreductase [Paraburkholderia sp.]
MASAQSGHAEKFDVLIVGAGHAGAQVALALLHAKFSGSIALLGDEQELPYERPSLSKEYLSGKKGFDRILLRPANFWRDSGIRTLPGKRVTAVQPDEHYVTCADGSTYGYGHLVWATGGVARQLRIEGHNLKGIHTLRNRTDADRIRAELCATERVVVVGGGYIGLEVAAALVQTGKRVTLVEALDRVLARVAGEPISRFYEAEHRGRGVDIRLGAAVESITGREQGRVSSVKLADGDVLDCDLLIVGVGILPATQPLVEAGATGGDGVEVDHQCRTSLPDIFAIGDCAAHSNSYAGNARIRLESVQNANDQAAVVAKVLCGVPSTYDAVPWFWSNQYDLKLQTVGISAGHDQTVVRGDTSTRSFSVIYLRGGRVVALDCVNAMKDYVQGKRLVKEKLVIAPSLLSDAARPLNEM